MKQVLRMLLAAVGILAVLAVAAVVYVTTFVDPEDFKPRLTKVVEEQTGLRLSLDGSLSWSFYPRIGVRVEQAQAWLPDQDLDASPFAAISSGEVSVAFAPLMRGEIAMDGLTIDGLTLILERDTDGRPNWESLLEHLRQQQGDAGSILAPASAGPNASDLNLGVVLSIARVELRDGEVYYRDHQGKQALHLESLNAIGTNVNPLTAFPIQATATVNRHASPDAEAMQQAPLSVHDLDLKAQARLAFDEQRYTLERLSLATINRKAPDEVPQQLDLTAPALDLKLDEQHLSVPEAQLNARLRRPSHWDGDLELQLSLALESDWKAQTASFKRMTLTGPDGLNLSGHLEAASLLQSPRLEGKLTAAPFNLRGWLARAGIRPDTAFESALRDVALTSPFTVEQGLVSLQDLSLAIDDTTLAGTLEAALNGERLHFELAGKALDLDRYLPPDPAIAQASDGFMRRAHAQETPIGLAANGLTRDWLMALDLKGRLALEQLTLGGTLFTRPRLSLDGQDGVHRLETFSAGVYQGTLDATGELDVRHLPLAWSLAPRLDAVQLGALISRLSGEASLLDGRLSLDGELKTRGSDRPTMIRQLSGELAAEVLDGKLRDINLSQQACSVITLLGDDRVRREWHPDTRFERIEASLDIRDGVAMSDDIEVALPGIQISGGGDLDLGNLGFDLNAAARLVNADQTACRIDPRLEQLELPIRCQGRLDGQRSDWCALDRDALREAARAVLQRQLEAQIGRFLGSGLLDDQTPDDNTADETPSPGSRLEQGLRRLLD